MYLHRILPINLIVLIVLLSDLSTNCVASKDDDWWSSFVKMIPFVGKKEKEEKGWFGFGKKDEKGWFGKSLTKKVDSSDEIMKSGWFENIRKSLISERALDESVVQQVVDQPSKDARARVKKNVESQITINGCGPSFFSERQLKLIPYGEFFKDCCNIHDSNYANCGFKKQEADHSFLDCMLNTINATSLEDRNTWPRIQKTFGYALLGLVDMFGCKAWEISQREVCSCE